MNRVIFSKFFPLLLICFNLLFWSYLYSNLYPIHLTEQIPFFFDLVEFHQVVPRAIIYFFGLGNILLIWFIAKKILPNWKAFIPPIVFSISPWSAYLIFAGSFYIYLLFFNLLIFLGILVLRSGKEKLGLILFTTGSAVILYSSILTLIIYPILITCLVIGKLVNFKLVKYSLLVVVVFCLPLFISMIKNQVGLKNIYHNQVMTFSDPGLISAVNQFQGESRQQKFGMLSRLSENKYIYYSKYVLFKVIKNITPATFFTSQEKLLMFSFTPPVFLGFLIPYLYGLFLILNAVPLRKYLLISLPLIIPSILSKFFVDLNRLVLIEPIIIFTTSFGLIKVIQSKKRVMRIILLLSIILVLLQMLVTILDISFREQLRFERFFGIKFGIEEQ